MKRTEGKGQTGTSVRAFVGLPLPWSLSSRFLPPSTVGPTLSSPLAWAVLLYLRHSGIKLRDSKVFPGLSTEKEKWLTFLKTKKVAPRLTMFLNQPGLSLA